MKQMLMPLRKPVSSESILYICLSLAVFIILLLRSILVPVTHDEATTYFNYVQNHNFIPFLAKGEANNHFLNSFLTFLSVQVFGTSALTLRLPNLLISFLYFYFIFKLAKEVKSQMLRWIFILVMLFTFHVIEFFALSRGYGISIAFLTGALWQTLLGTQKNDSRHYVYSNIFMLVSTLSILLEIYNLSLMLFWSLTMMIFAWPASKKVRNILIIGITGLIPLILAVSISLYLQKAGAYYDEVYSGLWDATLKTLFGLIIQVRFSYAGLPLILFSIIVLAPLILFIAIVLRQGKWKPHANLLFPFLLFGNLLIIVIVAKFFFHVYPEGRLMLFLYPVAICSVIFTTDLIIKMSGIRSFFIFGVPLLFFPIQSMFLINFEYVSWYNYCHIPRRFYNTVMDGWKKGEVLPTVSSHGLQAWAWQFLNREHNGKANEAITAAFPNMKTDFVIAELKYLNDWSQDYDTIDHDRISHLYLLKKKYPPHISLISAYDYQGNKNRQENEFQDILVLNLEEIDSCNLLIDLDFTIQTYSKPFRGCFVMEVKDANRKFIHYDVIHLNWINEYWTGLRSNFQKSWLLPVMKNHSGFLKIYLWNTGSTEYALQEGKIKILKVE